MAVSLDPSLAARLNALERRYVRLRAAVVAALSAGVAIGVVLSHALPGTLAQPQRTDEIITVRGLVVIDERGVERVRIGAPLPDPIVDGKRVPRQGVVSGLLIFDADGDERGGYVTEQTSGDAFLTLDAKGEQQTVFIANRDGGANLALWSGKGKNNNYISIRAVPTPMLEIVHNGKSVFRAGGADAFSK